MPPRRRRKPFDLDSQPLRFDLDAAPNPRFDLDANVCDIQGLDDDIEVPAQKRKRSQKSPSCRRPGVRDESLSEDAIAEEAESGEQEIRCKQKRTRSGNERRKKKPAGCKKNEKMNQVNRNRSIYALLRMRKRSPPRKPNSLNYSAVSLRTPGHHFQCLYAQWCLSQVA